MAAGQKFSNGHSNDDALNDVDDVVAKSMLGGTLQSNQSPLRLTNEEVSKMRWRPTDLNRVGMRCENRG